MHDVNYYQVLGVPMSADSTQIKAKYKVLAKKFHPDLNGDVKKMATINEAYRVLSDPHARHRYNQTLDIPKVTPRRHTDTSDGYVYTPHTYQRSNTNARPRPQSTRSRTYTPSKQKKSTVSKWAWAATFAVILGLLLGVGLRNPIPNTAASTLGTNTPTAQQTPTSIQQSPATPSNTLNDTPPATTYTDPTSSGTTQSDTNNSTQQACSKYRKYSRNYENCVNRSTSCSADTYYSYFDC